MAPAVLITGFGLSPLTFGLFFASTTIVVFGSGALAPRLARRWGPVVAARARFSVALAGSAAMLFGRADFASFSVSLTILLFGMGIFNPLGTAIALQPFAQQAGAASALLGFLQMGCAALAIAFGGMLAPPMYTALGVILFTSLLAAFLCFWSIRAATGTRRASAAHPWSSGTELLKETSCSSYSARGSQSVFLSSPPCACHS